MPLLDSLVAFWDVYVRKPFSKQLHNLWIFAGLSTISAIWKVRNKFIFEGRPIYFHRLCMSINSAIVHGGKFIPGYSQGFDTRIISSLGIQPIPRKAPTILPVLWSPPWFPWVKLNTDGLSKGNPGPAACGGVFRNCHGRFLGGFCQRIGHCNSFFAELSAIIIGIEFAYQRGWHCLWLESDSSSVISALQSSDFDPPWPLHTQWSICLDRIRKMTFYASHIYREGNLVADNFANMGLSSPSLTWHDSPPMAVRATLFSDYVGLPGYRFSN